MQSVPSPQTVHWTVWGFTPCSAPKVNIDLRSIWGAAPTPARGAASGLCKRGIAPFETRCCRLRRFGTLSQTLPKGQCPFGNPVLSASPIMTFHSAKSTICPGYAPQPVQPIALPQRKFPIPLQGSRQSHHQA